MIAGSAIAPAAAKGDAAKGKEIVSEQCGVCHSTDSDEKKMGPALKGLYKRKLKGGKPATDASVKAIINAGGNGMPAYQDMLSDEEKDHVLAYLKTL
jgi:mono/diheme cytochrome c family protein